MAVPTKEIAFHDLSFVLPNGITPLNTDGILGNMLAAYGVTRADPTTLLTDPRGFKYTPPGVGKPELTLTLAGICFSPFKDENEALGSDGTTVIRINFQTLSFRVSLVFWEAVVGGPDVMHIVPSAPDAYVIELNDNIGSTATLLNRPAPTRILSPKVERNGGVVLDGNYANLNFFVDVLRDTKVNDTLEFDFAFLELDTYLYLARDGVFANNQSSGGIQAFRAYYTLPMNVTTISGQPEMKYVTFRTLNFMPYPAPTQNPSVLDRNDIAYHIAATCPPWWHHAVAAPEAPSGTGDRIAIALRQAQPTAESFEEAREEGNKVVVDPQPPQPPQVMQAQALYKAMDEAGYIYKNHEPLNLWRPFFIRLLILLAFVIAVIWGVAQVLKGSGEN